MLIGTLLAWLYFIYLTSLVILSDCSLMDLIAFTAAWAAWLGL